ncbi:MAG: MBL fold metallo-hydrolase [Anaerolineae bacterium]
MSELTQSIRDTQVKPGTLAMWWISQAGFVYKTPSGTVLYVDPYLTDSVNRLFGFKRIMGTPVTCEEVEADYVLSTHAHGDHLDVDAVPVLVKNPHITFVGAPDCPPVYAELGVPQDRYLVMERGKTLKLTDIVVTGVYADHGDLAPDALGAVLTIEGIKVWHVGDSAYRPDMWQDVFAMGIDIIIPPINGAYGNLDGVTAAQLARDAGAKLAIPCHFWMFAEHNGNPAQFMTACAEYAPNVKPFLMTQGEQLIYKK